MQNKSFPVIYGQHTITMTTENKETPGELGMSLYEKIVDMAEGDCTELPTVISSLKEADSSGQFLTSSARYLWAVDRERFATQVSELIEAAIDRTANGDISARCWRLYGVPFTGSGPGS